LAVTDLAVDTSALVAVLLGEADAEPFAAALSGASNLRMSAPTCLGAALVAAVRSAGDGYRELMGCLDFVGIEIVPVDQALVEIAYAGWLRCGK
jgi:ribonuclease VapC